MDVNEDKNISLSNSIDYLNREEFINNILLIIENNSKKKESLAFAINGEWGCGKTWIVSEVQNKLSKKKDCIILNYNAWKNDYYDDPLLGIISSLAEEINNLVEKDTLNNVLINTLAIAQKGLLKITTLISERMIGIDVVKEGEDIIEICKNTRDRDKIVRNFDYNSNFKKAISQTTSILENITDNKGERVPIIILVDELDRCLPNYAIKTLERLHHIFSPLNNSVLIISTDMNQLDRTVASIFGNNIDVKLYLQKFINFSITLNSGIINEENFNLALKDYKSHFNLNKMPKDYNEFPNLDIKILSGLTIREKLNILKNAELLHKLAGLNDDLSYTHYLGELLISRVTFDCNKNDSKNTKEISKIQRILPVYNIKGPLSEFEKTMRKVFDGCAYECASNNLSFIDNSSYINLLYIYLFLTDQEDKFRPTNDQRRVSMRELYGDYHNLLKLF